MEANAKIFRIIIRKNGAMTESDQRVYFYHNVAMQEAREMLSELEEDEQISILTEQADFSCGWFRTISEERVQ